MNCSACGHFYSSEHLQCNECNPLMLQYCNVCKATTKFIKMNVNSPNSTMESLPSIQQPNVSCKEQPTYSVFPKQICEGVETQSRISEEHLSMKDSGEYIVQDIQETCNQDQTNEAYSTIGKNSIRNETDMRTLYMGASTAENSISFIGHLGHEGHEDNGKNLNVDELSKVEHASTQYKDARKENIFLFKEDPNDVSIIKTSEIRFMDSCESIQQFFGNLRSYEMAPITSNSGDQTNSLSTRALRDFDSHNTANSKEVVDNYLQTYSPSSFSQPPTYNCQHQNCQFNGQPRNKKLEMAMKTVSVSTESDPSLKSTCVEGSEEQFEAKLKTHDYLVMQAVGVSPEEQTVNMNLDKTINNDGMDQRMQKILETFKEDVKVTKFSENSHLPKAPPQVIEREQEKEHIEKKSSKKEDKNLELIAQLVNSHRCFYNRPGPFATPVNNLHLLARPQPAQQDPPLPQYQTLPCSAAVGQELLLKQTKFLNIKLVPAFMLNIPRSPIQCPESTCKRMIFVSDFNKHLVVDHNHLPMERITPFQCKNFFLDARLPHCGTSKCHLLYLMRDKVIDLGSSEYKDFLPILVMTTRISLNQMCGLRNKASTLEYFLIWVTGIAPEEFPISVLLTVWSRSGRVPSCHFVYSGQMYSIRNSQNALDVWQSGRMLLLSTQELDALTGNGKEMLNLQLSVH